MRKVELKISFAAEKFDKAAVSILKENQISRPKTRRKPKGARQERDRENFPADQTLRFFFLFPCRSRPGLKWKCLLLYCRIKTPPVSAAALSVVARRQRDLAGGKIRLYCVSQLQNFAAPATEMVMKMRKIGCSRRRRRLLFRFDKRHLTDEGRATLGRITRVICLLLAQIPQKLFGKCSRRCELHRAVYLHSKC
jgi:hypothetical protein